MVAVALLDANVIWSAALRDLLLRVAAEGAFRPVWSERILEEMTRTLVERRGLDPKAIARTVALMRQHFPAAMVAGYERHIPAMRNAPGDRHVLAAAIEAGASVLVTANTRDFPATACTPYGIQVQPPDDFLCSMWQTDSRPMVAALTRQAAGLRNPPQSPRDVLQTLARTVPRFAGRVLDTDVL